MSVEKNKFRKYLLGALSEADMKEFDLRIISGEDLEEDLQLAEHELMEAYLEGTLAADDAEYFEKEFLACDDRRNDLDFLRLIKKHAGERSAAAPVFSINVKPEKRSFASAFNEAFAGWKMIRMAAGFAVLVLIGFGFFWILISPQTLSPDVLVQMNHRDLSDPEQLKNKSTLDLDEGGFRSGGNAPKLRGDNLSDEVLIRLVLPLNMTEKSYFDVDLLRNDKKVKYVPAVRSYFNGTGQEMRLLFRPEDLKKGDYQIELRQGQELPFTYSFSVE